MKFHCDRCNKPYVIADERVRGKILKIRCKSCSAIITVREGMDQVGVAAGSGGPEMRHSVVGEQGALDSVSPGSPGLPGRQDTFPQEQPPALTGNPDLDPEWHLSVGGEQEGPYSLVDARKWISQRDADVEVYCWRDGFDDWRLVEEVPFFQKVRRRRQSKLILVPPPPHMETEPVRTKEERLSSQGIRPSVMMAAIEPTNGGDLELDIDEPSRMFSLTGLEPGAGGVEPTRQERGRLPGMTPPPPAQEMPFLPDDDAAPLAPGRQRSVLPLLVVVILIIAAAAALVLWVSRRGDQAEVLPRTTSPSNLEDLGYRVEPGGRKAPEDGEAVDPEDTGAASGDDTGVGREARGRKAGPARGRAGESARGAGEEGRSDGSGGAEAVPGEESLAALTPDDIIRESTRSGMWFRRCYERARKNDPFLSVKSIKIDVTVSPDGSVSDVKLSSHEDTILGQCIASGVSRWQFRATRTGIKSQIPLVFEQQ